MTEGIETLPTLCVLRYHISGKQNKNKENKVCNHDRVRLPPSPPFSTPGAIPQRPKCKTPAKQLSSFLRAGQDVPLTLSVFISITCSSFLYNLGKCSPPRTILWLVS